MTDEPKKPNGARRLRNLQRGSKTKVVNRIRPGSLEKVEAHLDKMLPLSASDAEITSLLLHYEDAHPEDFGGVAYNGGADLSKMSNLERWEHANKLAEEARKAKAKADIAANVTDEDDGEDE